jgi:hypothetical protein
MSDQWSNFLQNLGTWQGSFADMTLNGEILSDVPSILSLSTVDGDRDVVRLHLRRFAGGDVQGTPTSDICHDFTSLGRHIIFAETGCFSKGGMCLSSITNFVAEFGFVYGDRRLRMVQMYDDNFRFKQLVFIREFREGTNAQERPPLTVEQLAGVWEAESLTYKPNFDPPTHSTGRLRLNIAGDSLESVLEFGDRQITSKARIAGNQIQFSDSPLPRQITLLPDGGSINVPLELKRNQAFFVEVGWLVEADLRLRIMRNFDAAGNWESCVFITERRVN